MTLRLVDSKVTAAAEAGLKLLDRKAVTEKALREYLSQQGFDASCVEMTVGEFQQRGWLNDTDYADQLVSQRAAKAGMSRAKLVADMRKRGLEAAQIDAALDTLDAAWEEESAYRFAAARLQSSRADVDAGDSQQMLKLRQKIWRQLASRGFPSQLCQETARRVIAELERGEGYSDE